MGSAVDDGGAVLLLLCVWHFLFFLFLEFLLRGRARIVLSQAFWCWISEQSSSKCLVFWTDDGRDNSDDGDGDGDGARVVGEEFRAHLII